MVNKYSMFFDESQKTDVLRFDSSGKLNFASDDDLQSFIGVFCGLPSSEVSSFNEQFLSFENHQRDTFNLKDEHEIKSTTISRKQFKYGFASLNRNSKSFYTELLTVIKDADIIFTLAFFNKIDHLLMNMITNLRIGDEDRFNFYYILSKFLSHYGYTKIFRQYYSNPDEAVYLLSETMKRYARVDKDIFRLRYRNNAYNSVARVLDNAVYDLIPISEVPFSYVINPDSLVLHLHDLDIEPSDVDLFIDGDENSEDHFSDFFTSIEYVNSKNYPLIRASDHLAGLFSRLCFFAKYDKGRQECSIDDSREEKERLRLLSPDWFKIDESAFILYHLFFEAILVNNQQYWSMMTSYFHDDLSYVVNLVYYFSEFDCFDDYRKKAPEVHSREFEQYALTRKEMHPDFPYDHISVLYDHRLY